jgi:hypothetical protein
MCVTTMFGADTGITTDVHTTFAADSDITVHLWKRGDRYVTVFSS